MLNMAVVCHTVYILLYLLHQWFLQINLLLFHYCLLFLSLTPVSPGTGEAEGLILKINCLSDCGFTPHPVFYFSRSQWTGLHNTEIKNNYPDNCQ